MKGVEILNEIICTNFSLGSYLLLSTICCILVWWCWFGVRKMQVPKSMAAAVASVAVVFWIIISVAAFIFYRTPWTEYDIIVSDSVSYNEFTNKYEVINVNGKILRVKER